MLLRSGHRPGRRWSNRIRIKRVDFGNAIFSDLTDELVATDLRRRADPHLLPRQGLRGGLRAGRAEAARHATIAFVSSTADEQLWLISASSDREPGERYLFDRAHQGADAAVHGLREAAAAAARADDGDQLPVVRRPDDPGLPDAARRRRRQEPADDRLPARRAVGARQLGLRRRRRSSWPTAATPCCSRTSAARPATARSSSTPATTSGARRCRTTSPGA